MSIDKSLNILHKENKAHSELNIHPSNQVLIEGSISNVQKSISIKGENGVSNKELLESTIPSVLRSKVKRKSKKSPKNKPSKLLLNNMSKTKKIECEIIINNNQYPEITDKVQKQSQAKPLFKDDEYEIELDSNFGKIEEQIINKPITTQKPSLSENSQNKNNNVTKIENISEDIDYNEIKCSQEHIDIPTFSKLRINEDNEPIIQIIDNKENQQKKNEELFKSESTEEYDYSVDTEEFRFNNKKKQEKILTSHSIKKTRNLHAESKLLSLINDIHKTKGTIEYSEKASTPCSLRDKGNLTCYSKHSFQTIHTQMVEQNSIVEIKEESISSNDKDANILNKDLDSMDGMELINTINKAKSLNTNTNTISYINDKSKDLGNIPRILTNNNFKEYYPKKKIAIITNESNNTPGKESQLNTYSIKKKHINFTADDKNSSQFPLSSSKNSRKSSNKNIFGDNSSAFTPTKNNFLNISKYSINNNNNNNSNLKIGLLGLYPNNNVCGSQSSLQQINNQSSQNNFNTISYSNNIANNNSKNNNNNLKTSQNTTNHPNSSSIKGVNKPNINYQSNYFLSNTKKNQNVLNMNTTYSTAFNTITYNNTHHQSNYSNSTHHSSNQIINNQFQNTTAITNNTNNTNYNNPNSQINSNHGSMSLCHESEIFPEMTNNRQYPMKIPTEESMHSLNSYNPHLSDLQSPTNMGGFPPMFSRMEFNKTNFSSSFNGGNMSSPYNNLNLFGKNNIHLNKTNQQTANLHNNINNNISSKTSNNLMTNMNSMNNMSNIMKMNRAVMLKSTMSSSYYNNTISNSTYIPPVKEYADFEIRLEDIASGKETRSTLMIKNVPNKYTLDNALHEINEKGFKHKFNFFYLPPDLEVSY